MQISVTRRDETASEAYQRRQAGAAVGLSFGLVSGPLTWGIHFVILWALMEMGCFVGLHTMRVAGTNLLNVVLIGSTMIALPIMIAGLIGAAHYLRGCEAAEAAATGRGRALALTGVLLNPVFIVAALLEVSALMVAPICGAISA